MRVLRLEFLLCLHTVDLFYKNGRMTDLMSLSSEEMYRVLKKRSKVKSRETSGDGSLCSINCGSFSAIY